MDIFGSGIVDMIVGYITNGINNISSLIGAGSEQIATAFNIPSFIIVIIAAVALSYYVKSKMSGTLMWIILIAAFYFIFSGGIHI